MLNTNFWKLSVVLWLTAGSVCGRSEDLLVRPDQAAPVSSADEAFPAGLPAIGKWMIAPDDAPARWLNEVYYGKQLREPVNVIFVDHAAKSAVDATNRLLRALTAAGFPLRFGHSHGYSALIAGARHGQLVAGKATAFSDEPFELNNNHGRIFGPYNYGDTYLFTGAFSRERIDPIAQVKHEFVSFNQARDALAQRMERKTHFQRARFISLDNALLSHPYLTTGDHDGIAVLLEARE